MSINPITHLRKHGISLGTVMLISLMANALIILLLTGSFMVARSNETVVKIATQTTQQTADNISKTVASLISDKSQTLRDIQAVVEHHDLTPDVQQDALQTIYHLNSDLISIAVYDTEGTLIHCVTDESFALKEHYHEINLSFLADEFASSGDVYISPPHINNIFHQQYPWVVTLMMRGVDEQEEPIYITMDIQFSKISQYIDRISIGDRGYIFITDEDGNIVYHPQQQLIYAQLKSEDTSNDKTTIRAISQVENTPWNIVGVSSVDELVQMKNDEFLEFSIIVVLVALGFSLVVAMLLSEGFSLPVKQLIRAMQRFERDVDTHDTLGLSGFEEVRDLSASFDHMADRIKELKERVVLEEKELRKSELKALQAQINPHFLYNTLDSIFWLCKENDNTDAADMVSALSTTFRISTSRGRDEITIRDEMKHVQSYLLIQNKRYKDQFQYRFDVDPEILDYLCLKIILQPFVENAIYHGLNRMVDEGEIVIRGYREEDEIFLKVIDNGIGMDEEQITAIFEGQSDKAGIGVKNVHNRLRIYYGEGYGVTATSELDEGTEITLTLPAYKGGDDGE